METCKRLLEIYTNDIENRVLPLLPSNEELATKLNSIIHKAAKICRQKVKHTQNEKQIYYYETNDNELSSKEIYIQLSHHERKKWNQILKADDPKELWKSINWKGEINDTIKTNEPITADELATFASKKLPFLLTSNHSITYPLKILITL